MGNDGRLEEISSFMRSGVPLPPDLTGSDLALAISHTEMIFTEFYEKTGVKLANMLQANTLSGIVSNMLTVRIADVTRYIPNPDEKKYPDLVWGGPETHPGIEIKATTSCNKGAEAHNGHSGWHIVAAYKTTERGGIRIYQVLAADLVGYGGPDSDWSYQGSASGKGGSQRTETYSTNPKGTAKLRDGMVLLDTETREKDLGTLLRSRIRVERNYGLAIPAYSPFYALVHRQSVSISESG